jgi:beta-glucosidase-like glycosyl hydrolase
MPDKDTELLKAVEAEVEALDEEQLEAKAKEILDAQAKRKSYRTEKSPEQIAKQKAYRAKKYAFEKAVLAKARSMGLIEEPKK